MGGQVTFLDGLHSSRNGSWVMPIEQSNKLWSRLEEILGRKLTDDERAVIDDGLSGWRDVADNDRTDGVTRQDIFATLKAFSKLPDEAVPLALRNMDGFSHALVSYEMSKGMSATDAGNTSIEKLNGKANVGGRHSKGYQRYVCDFALLIWRNCGRSDIEVTMSSNPAAGYYRGTPLVEWTQAMLDCAGGTISAAPRQAVELLRKTIVKG